MHDGSIDGLGLVEVDHAAPTRATLTSYILEYQNVTMSQVSRLFPI